MTSNQTQEEHAADLLTLLDEVGLSNEQKEKLINNMDRAIFLNFSEKIAEKLHEDQLEELEQIQSSNGSEKVLDYLCDFLSESEVKSAFSKSAEEVWSSFFAKLSQ